LFLALKKAGMPRPKIVVVTPRLESTVGGEEEEEESAQSPITRLIARGE